MKEEIKTYIEKYPYDVREMFLSLREMILSLDGGISEKMWAKMPEYRMGDKFIRLIAFKDHINIQCEAIQEYTDRLGSYKFTPKGFLQIYTDDNIPEEILNEAFGKYYNGEDNKYEDTDIVLVKEIISDIIIELKYATEDNFTGQVIYESNDAYLRYGTLRKLRAAQEKAKMHGCRLVVWDAFRPKSAQFKLWEVCPNDDYVADPYKGSSRHNRGCAVDVSFVDENGNMPEMPSEYDDFSSLADRDYSDVSVSAAKNSSFLEEIMTSSGFRAYFNEWWHYNDTEDYDVVE